MPNAKGRLSMEMSNQDEPFSQLAQYLQVIHVYKKAKQNFSYAYLGPIWSELRGTSPEFLVPRSALQNAFSNISGIVKGPVGKIDLNAILEYLNEALKEL